MGAEARDLESGKQLETRSSGGELKDNMPVLPVKDRARGNWDVLAKDWSTGGRNLSAVLSTQGVCTPSSFLSAGLGESRDYLHT